MPRAMEPVDVELVLAVDVSRSVDAEEQEMQFNGYAAAFRDRRLIDAMVRGPVGSVAVTFFTWSGLEHPGASGALDEAGRAGLRRTLRPGHRRRTLPDDFYTSISGAMDFATRLFGQGFEGTRRVVDISGDGINNSGREVGPRARMR